MKPVFNRFRSRCAGAFISALVALQMAMPCPGQDMSDWIWMQQQSQFNVQMQMMMANVQARMQMLQAANRAEEEYRAMFDGLTVAGKRAEYRKFRQEVRRASEVVTPRDYGI